MLNDLAAFSDAIMSSRMDAEWSYDRKVGRYRNEKGQFLSKKAVGAIVDGRISKLEQQLKSFTEKLVNGSITLDQWQGSVREAIKIAHIQVATIGYGGKAEMGSSEYGRIGQRLRSEYTYLQGFVRDLIDGRISAPMAMARIGLYAQSVRGSYWQGTEMKEQQRGFSMMRRVLDDQAVHCQDCIGYAARGMVSIGSLPMPGVRCECGARCKCSVVYYRGQAQVVPV
jgi:hypothetical protein